MVVEAYERAASARAEGSTLMDFVGNIEGVHVIAGGADVDRLRRLHRQHRAEADRGHVEVDRSTCVRNVTLSSPRAATGGMMLRPALRRLRADLDPEGAGGAYLLGLRKLGVVAHGRFTSYGWSQAILLAARGTAGDVVGRTHARAGGGRCAAAPAPVMSEVATTVPGQR